MKKLIIIVLIIFIVAITPVILLSNWFLGIIQDKIDNNEKEEWTANWQWKLGTIYRWTFREDRGVDCYRKFMQRYPLDSRYPDAKYYLANCLEHSGQREEAIKEYQEFASWYPQHPNAETASKKAVNLRYMYR